MEEIFNLFIKHLEHSNISVRTINNYRTTWDKFRKWGVSSGCLPKNPSLANEKDIRMFKEYLEKYGGKRGGAIKPNTLNLTFVQLNRIFKYFTTMQFITENPVSLVKMSSTKKNHPRWLTKEEQKLLMIVLQEYINEKEYTIILLMLFAGLKVHEICQLHETDLFINPKSGFIFVKGNGKGGRYIPLHPQLYSALHSYLYSRGRDHFTNVFNSERSSAISIRGIQHIIKKYQKLADLEHLNCQVLRNTFARELVLAGYEHQTIAKLMGLYKKNGEPNPAMIQRYVN
ncbi:tyrosine-type recombinase/integrase [Paenibacillus sp. 7523-1]|uniref:tyrosine-type recombinase/integrase n=1 Tax=Paenibacillus sp. 7523-1 TaxID=2022550 RepID=UPI000BA6EA89|nr:tyrosine-type recombinase/integrase [Paenibacillus sp. 7523-1]PAD28712.1 hypothetical protein CHH60_23720 [Paenibacillus sp. 7523-1]